MGLCWWRGKLGCKLKMQTYQLVRTHALYFPSLPLLWVSAFRALSTPLCLSLLRSLFSPAHIHTSVRCVCFFLCPLPPITTAQRCKAELWGGQRNFLTVSTVNSQTLIVATPFTHSPPAPLSWKELSSLNTHSENCHGGKKKKLKKTTQDV